MKRILIALAVLLLLSGQAFCQDKVGFVNLQRLLDESAEGRAAGAGYQKELEQKKADLQTRFKEVERLRLLLENEGPRMTEDKRSDLIMQYDRTASEYERLFRETEDEMRRKNGELIVEVLKKADPIMREIAKERDYSMVIKEPNSLGYLNPRVDITSEILKRMKEGRPAAPDAAKPAAKPAAPGAAKPAAKPAAK